MAVAHELDRFDARIEEHGAEWAAEDESRHDRSPQAQKRRLQCIMRLWQKGPGAGAAPERMRVKGFSEAAAQPASKIQAGLRRPG